MLRQWRAATPILKFFKLQIKDNVVPRIYVLHVQAFSECSSMPALLYKGFNTKHVLSAQYRESCPLRLFPEQFTTESQASPSPQEEGCGHLSVSSQQEGCRHLPVLNRKRGLLQNAEIVCILIPWSGYQLISFEILQCSPTRTIC